MIWSCGLQYEGVISQKGHPSVLVILEGRNTPRITVFFRDVEACFDIKKQLAPFADIVDYYGRLYPSQTTFGAYVTGELLQ